MGPKFSGLDSEDSLCNFFSSILMVLSSFSEVSFVVESVFKYRGDIDLLGFRLGDIAVIVNFSSPDAEVELKWYFFIEFDYSVLILSDT